MPSQPSAGVSARPATRAPLTDDALIRVQAMAIHAICGQLTAGQLEALRSSVQRATLMPKRFGWDHKATAHAEIFGLLADAADYPVLAQTLNSGVGLARLGWRLDADFATGPDFRVVQLTPPGSPGSVIFGTGISCAAPGSAEVLQLVVTDIDAARQELISHGADVSGVFHDAGGVSTTREAKRGWPTSCGSTCTSRLARPTPRGSRSRTPRRYPRRDNRRPALPGGPPRALRAWNPYWSLSSRLPKASIQLARAVACATVIGGSTTAASAGPWISVCDSGDHRGRVPSGSGAPAAGSRPETRTW